MKKLVLLHVFFGLAASLWSCSNRENNSQSGENRTIVSGQLQVLTDETLLPIMEEQVAVFEHLYRRADVELAGARESQVISKLLNREVEVVVLTRLLTEEETAFFKARKFVPQVYKFATDAIAFVVNKQVSDSTITLDHITEILRGNAGIGSLSRLVFDNPNSSTVRLLKEIAGIDSLPTTGVYAMQSNPEVLKYVYETPQSVGVVGINWIARPDSSIQKYIDGVKVLALKGRQGERGGDGYYKPSQSNLAENLYALARPVYIINAEPRKSLGMGFAAFLTGESGQRVVLKSGLMPDSLPPRELIIR